MLLSVLNQLLRDDYILAVKNLRTIARVSITETFVFANRCVEVGRVFVEQLQVIETACSAVCFRKVSLQFRDHYNCSNFHT
jgi:hypothetical protein